MSNNVSISTSQVKLHWNMHLDAGESKTQEMPYFFCFMDYSDLEVSRLLLFIQFLNFITLSAVNLRCDRLSESNFLLLIQISISFSSQVNNASGLGNLIYSTVFALFGCISLTVVLICVFFICRILLVRRPQFSANKNKKPVSFIAIFSFYLPLFPLCRNIVRAIFVLANKLFNYLCYIVQNSAAGKNLMSNEIPKRHCSICLQHSAITPIVSADISLQNVFSKHGCLGRGRGADQQKT